MNRQKRKHQFKSASTSTEQPSAHPSNWYSADRSTTLLLWAIIALTFLAYLPSLRNGFTNWDDQEYVTKSELIKSFSNALLSTNIAANYHPLTMISLAVNYYFSGLHPYGYHLTNLLFHLANTLLAFYFIYLLSSHFAKLQRSNAGKKSTAALISALFFGVHPMHVESVAWVAERKDVLFCFFFLAALISYLRYMDTNKMWLYAITIVLFLLSLFSKSQAVVLPVIFILTDYFLRRPINLKNLLPKIPFFILSFIFGLKAIYVQREFGAIGENEIYSMGQKICFASYSVLAYLGKLIAPVNLSTFYPYPAVKTGMPAVYMASPFILAGIIITVFLVWRRNRTVMFGSLLFLAPLGLVLQFVSVGNAIMADRYTYLPYMGIFFIIGMGCENLKEKKSSGPNYLKQSIPVVIVLFGIMSAGITYKRTQVWKNSETLWTDVISKFPEHSTGHMNRGDYYEKNEQWDKAIADYSKAIEVNAGYYNAYFTRGNIYFRKKSFDDALADYTNAIEIRPNSFNAWHNRSVAYGNKNDRVKALEDEIKAIQFGQKEDSVYMKWLKQ